MKVDNRILFLVYVAMCLAVYLTLVLTGNAVTANGFGAGMLTATCLALFFYGLWNM